MERLLGRVLEDQRCTGGGRAQETDPAPELRRALHQGPVGGGLAPTPSGSSSGPNSGSRSGSGLGELLAELQSYGVRVEDGIQARRGGAGPSDAGMIRVEGVPVTFPFTADYVAESPYVLRREEAEGQEDGGGWGVYREGRRLAGAAVPPRPEVYELTAADR